MIKYSVELEDVCFSALRDNETGDWTVKLWESDQSQGEFGRKGEEALTAELTLDDLEMAALMFLATNNDEASQESIDEMYEALEPKLTGLPIELRPVP